MAAEEPERTEGPTPNGGAYAFAYFHDDGSMEIVEFDANDNEIHRTYSGPARDLITLTDAQPTPTKEAFDHSS